MTRNSPAIHSPAVIAKLFRSRSGGGLRYLLALFTVVSFVLLSATAATHFHATSLEEQACSLCPAVNHQLGDAPVIPVVTAVAMLLLFEVLTLTKLQLLPASPILLPPSCGPPKKPVGFC
ncbi:MAG: hypothetical protein KGM99_19575 [Burkholderiales bacterium]|nr:hypothetical protein [Burkholderiales bacterium]